MPRPRALVRRSGAPRALLGLASALLGTPRRSRGARAGKVRIRAPRRAIGAPGRHGGRAGRRRRRALPEPRDDRPHRGPEHRVLVGVLPLCAPHTATMAPARSGRPLPCTAILRLDRTTVSDQGLDSLPTRLCYFFNWKRGERGEDSARVPVGRQVVAACLGKTEENEFGFDALRFSGVRLAAREPGADAPLRVGSLQRRSIVELQRHLAPRPGRLALARAHPLHELARRRQPRGGHRRGLGEQRDLPGRALGRFMGPARAPRPHVPAEPGVLGRDQPADAQRSRRRLPGRELRGHARRRDGGGALLGR